MYIFPIPKAKIVKVRTRCIIQGSTVYKELYLLTVLFAIIVIYYTEYYSDICVLIIIEFPPK